MCIYVYITPISHSATCCTCNLGSFHLLHSHPQHVGGTNILQGPSGWFQVQGLGLGPAFTKQTPTCSCKSRLPCQQPKLYQYLAPLAQILHRGPANAIPLKAGEMIQALLAIPATSTPNLTFSPCQTPNPTVQRLMGLSGVKAAISQLQSRQNVLPPGSQAYSSHRQAAVERRC